MWQSNDPGTITVREILHEFRIRNNYSTITRCKQISSKKILTQFYVTRRTRKNARKIKIDFSKNSRNTKSKIRVKNSRYTKQLSYLFFKKEKQNVNAFHFLKIMGVHV